MAAINLSNGLTTFNYTSNPTRTSSSIGWSLNINIGSNSHDSLLITTGTSSDTYYVKSDGTLTTTQTAISDLSVGVYLFSVSGIMTLSNVHRIVILNVGGTEVYRTGRATIDSYETNGVFNFTGPIAINTSTDKCYLTIDSDSDQGFICRDMRASICRIA